MIIDKAIRYIVYGQVVFLASLVACALLLPQGLAANDGFSYYGVHLRTVLPYSVGMVLLAWFYLKATRLFSLVLVAKVATYIIYVLLALLVMMVATPYRLNATFHWLHVFATFGIFGLQVALSIWLVMMVRWDGLNILLLILLVTEVALAAYSLQPVSGFLIQYETAFQVTFSILLARSIAYLPRKVNPPAISVSPTASQ